MPYPYPGPGKWWRRKRDPRQVWLGAGLGGGIALLVFLEIFGPTGFGVVLGNWCYSSETEQWLVPVLFILPFLYTGLCLLLAGMQRKFDVMVGFGYGAIAASVLLVFIFISACFTALARMGESACP